MGDMVSPMENQIVFRPKQEKVAEFTAYLTNSMTYKDEKGNVVLAAKSALNEKIAQMLEKKDFIGASELLENVKRLQKEYQETAEIASKSIRMPFITYLKLIEFAQKKNISLSDALRITSIPAMKEKLDEFRDLPSVDQEKLKTMYDLLTKWREKKPSSGYKKYSPEHRYRYGDDVSNLFETYTKFSICEKGRKYENIPVEMLKEYVEEHGDFGVLWDWDLMAPNVELEFDEASNSPKLTIWWATAAFFYNYKESKESIDDINLRKKLDEILDFEHCEYDEVEDILTYGVGINISFTLHIKNNKLFFDSVNVEDKSALNALIYEKITNQKYPDFAVDECIKKVQEAIARDDYNTASQINGKLAMFQVVQDISNWYSDIISSIVEETNVVTFTIPKLLLMLWEAAKGERSIQEFVEENLERYKEV
jgi:ribosomal protein S8